MTKINSNKTSKISEYNTLRFYVSLNTKLGHFWRLPSANYELMWHKKQAKYQKSGPINFYNPWSVASSHGRGDSFWKWPDFQL